MAIIEDSSTTRGLKVSLDKRIPPNQVEIESDNAILISVLQNRFAASNIYSKVQLLHDWCFKDWNVTFRQIVRDNNRMVDCLTREAQGGMEKLFIHVDPPIYVRNLLEDDSVVR
ncbi:hypothetical protein Gotri_008658 [Gossypium trilobum]|uniref:RNase H type-1 domain-containing protein n=1 Tax=Gossypium trilobum TaxID=34281 RepID=A0A7J9EK25_9ROSI|nr:hypothetical protein [Gossypium trilobum]